MKQKLFSIIIACSMLCAAWLPGLTSFAEELNLTEDSHVSIKVVHTNDIHGRSGYQAGSVIGFEKLKTWIQQEDADLVLDGGDTFHGQAFATLERGESIAQLMKAVGYDAMTPGNHDWNYGKEQLKTLSTQSGTPILAGNVSEQGQAYFGNNGTLIKDIEGVKVGILGVFDQEITNSTAPTNIQGLSFGNDAEKANALAEELRAKGCDIVIALSHQSRPDAFIGETSGIDFLIAGHEHITLDSFYVDRDGKQVKAVEAGSFFKNAGMLTISYDKQEQKIDSATETLISDSEAAGMNSDGTIAGILDTITQRQKQQMSQVIGSVGTNLEGRWEQLRIDQTNLGKVVTAAYLEETGADIAIENAGGIRLGRILPAGTVTYKDILDIAPFSNYIVTKQIKGSSVKFVLEKSVQLGIENKKAYDEWVKTGSDQTKWPDDSGSYLQFGGVTAVYDVTKPEGKRVSKVEIGGEQLEKDKLYTVATNNFAAINKIYPELASAEEENQYAACDEALTRFIQKGQTVVDQAASAAGLKVVSPETEKPSEEKPTGETVEKDPGNTNVANQDKAGNKNNTAAKTGDITQTGIVIAIILCAIAITLIAVVVRRKRSGPNEQ